MKLGLQNQKLKQITALSSASTDEKLSLVRTVFGEYQHCAIRGGLHVSQNLVLYPGNDSESGFDGFDFTSDVHRGMTKQQHIGIYSHAMATRDSISSFLGASPCKHAIVSCPMWCMDLHVQP